MKYNACDLIAIGYGNIWLNYKSKKQFHISKKKKKGAKLFEFLLEKGLHFVRIEFQNIETEKSKQKKKPKFFYNAEVFFKTNSIAWKFSLVCMFLKSSLRCILSWTKEEWQWTLLFFFLWHFHVLHNLGRGLYLDTFLLVGQTVMASHSSIFYGWSLCPIFISLSFTDEPFRRSFSLCFLPICGIVKQYYSLFNPFIFYLWLFWKQKKTRELIDFLALDHTPYVGICVVCVCVTWMNIIITPPVQMICFFVYKAQKVFYNLEHGWRPMMMSWQWQRQRFEKGKSYKMHAIYFI